MNRIEHRIAVLGGGALDGAQMQRRMLQEMERQWLESWGSAQSESASDTVESTPKEKEMAASFQAPGSEQLTSESVSLSSNSRNAEASKTDRSGTETATSATPERPLAQGSERQAERPPADNEQVASDRAPMSMAAIAAPAPATGGLSVVTGAWSTSSSALAGEPPLSEAPLTASTLASVSDRVATLADQSVAAQASPPAEDGEGDTPSAGLRRSRPPQPAQTGDFGPHKLTLRELAPDLVQATLRDTQLNTAASHLAAQGLARALMEAGYAQVKVVVNGRHSDEYRDCAAASDTPAMNSLDSSPTTLSKDPVHGY